MKKTYISPETKTVKIGCEIMIAGSEFTLDGTKTATEGNGGFVKGQSSTPSSYSVWDDDWSN